MEFTLIWLTSDHKELAAMTAECLKKLKHTEQLLLIADEGVSEDETFSEHFAKICFLPLAGKNYEEQINCARQHLRGDYATTIENGDVIPADYFTVIEQELADREEQPSVFMTVKYDANGKRDAFAGKSNQKADSLVDLERQFTCLPYFFGGSFIKTEYMKTHPVDEHLPYDYEKAYLLPLVMENRYFVLITQTSYTFSTVKEGDATFYPGVYQEGWYRQSIQQFWIPFLQSTQEERGYIPEFVQYFAIYCLGARFRANLNNTNKHLIPEHEAYDYMRSFHVPFAYLDDSVLLNARRLAALGEDLTLRQLYLRIKHQQDHLQFEHYVYQSKSYLGYGNVLVAPVADQTVNIKLMEYQNGVLEIDASVSALLDFEEGELFIRKNGEEIYQPQWDEIYSLTKCFGVSYTKRKAFHASIPVGTNPRDAISFMYRKNRREWKLVITYASHFSRLTKRFRNSYWNIDNKLMARHVKGDIVIYQIRRRSVVKREAQLLLEMLWSKKKIVRKFACCRMLFFLYKYFYRKQSVWLYIDKIYKAGDSSEYLYKYAVAQKAPNIRHYYLVDKKCSDYERLKKEGYKPLVRGTLKHRMLFLLADTVVISNSTVFAYNDYTLDTSAYIRDLVKFRVACVQHGMSVQNIAVAQNRLRDNTSLYFCASPYEIKNLSRPVYGYVGRDVLKLTGVPRYDGLVNRDQKQILISPTWRMQAAVPVTKNEGVARDYNPLFKETSYFTVYNRLINHPRLIEAAKHYGYRIVYVLHPIVSPQVGDFDQNPYVDVVPAIGDMSYEKVFCESSLMVTDFSGVQFDFAYMRKPVIYYHTPELPPHYDEGGFIYETMGFGEICETEEALVNLLLTYMQNGCQMQEQYKKRADDFFAFRDHNNCQRIYEEMIK
jgi:CDP-glycerol glycerophosphotransferase (TagB/SpsB family)